MESERFQIWRPFAAVACVVAAFVFWRANVNEIAEYGTGVVSALHFFAAAVCLAAGIGVPFKKAAAFATWVAYFLVTYTFCTTLLGR